MVNPCKNKLLALHLQSISFGEERIATLAQLVEQRIRNAQVEGSNPLSGSKKIRRKIFRLIFLLFPAVNHITPEPIISSLSYHTANCPGVMPLCGVSKRMNKPDGLLTSNASCNGWR